MAARGEDTSDDLVMTLLLCIIVVLVVGYFAKPYVQYAVLYVSYYELRALEIVSQYIPFLTGEILSKARGETADVLVLGVAGMDNGIAALGDESSAYTQYAKYENAVIGKRIPQLIFMTPFVIAGAWVAYLVHQKAPYKNTGKMSIDEVDMHLAMSQYAARVTVGRQFDRRHPTKDKQARFSRKPWELAVDYKLLSIGKDPYETEYEQNGVLLIKPNIHEARRMVFDSSRAEALMIKQLGSRYNKPEDVLRFQPEKRALLVAFLCTVDDDFNAEFGKPMSQKEFVGKAFWRRTNPNYDHALDGLDSTEKWLAQFSTSFYDSHKVEQVVLNGKPNSILPKICRENLDIEGVDAALAWALKSVRIRTLIMESAYDNVLLVKLMERMKICSGKFQWLKIVNRSCWYGLNNTNRPRRDHVEGSAIQNHAEYERKAAERSVTPRVTESVSALKNELIKHEWVLG